MVVDTSAIMALLRGEPEAEWIDNVLRASPQTVKSAANHVELMIVVESRTGAPGVLVADEVLRRMEVASEAVDHRVAQMAVAG